ncbi:LysR family transcriptional regulator substrate-binding protein [uncultured Brevibacillus sp.]|uniref:LysR family transcriptional regulator substrate-binding protein n=1 Tax=uncultured Brevibacillus sp. TaxID=169970 RepID=UPI00259574FA|nr:LysR family transcriptional regulator substrate-binding protein [uncultured Brevibacillus sp.]
MKHAGITPRVRFEVLDTNTIGSMIQEGLGITIGPELMFKKQPGIHIGQLREVNWRCLSLACPSIACASPAVQAFLSVAKSCFESNE